MKIIKYKTASKSANSDSNSVETKIGDQRLVLEVEQHIGNNRVRCLAMGATEGLTRGVEVVDTGQGSSSDASGSYMITGVNPGLQNVKASYIGHRTQTKSVEVSAGGANLNFALAVSAVSGEGVFVTGTRAAGRTAMKSPTPIDGFDNMTLRRQGNGDITETLTLNFLKSK